jgi:hypothetical protein
MGLFDFLSPKKDKHEEKEKKVINNIIVQESARGSSGSEVYAGYFDEEYLDSIKGKDRAKEFDKIRRSSTQAKMLLLAVKNPIKTASREIIPCDDKPESEIHAELCKQVLFKDIKFNKFMNEALTIIEFGHSVFERVHKIHIDKGIKDRDGNQLMNSYIGYRKLGWRSPKTIETWNFNEDKELCSVTQQADGDLAVYVDMPVEHLSIMTLDQEGDNYEGMSMLRPCYGNFFRSNEYLKLNAIGIEKSMPIPTAEVPPGQENSDQFARLTETLQSFTTHQKNYITYPMGWNVTLSNGTNYDPSKVEQSIDNEDKRMAKAFLANFLELGMSGTGAYSLSNDLSDFFLSGISYIADIIKEELDEMIKELVILNFGEQDRYPEFKFSGIKDKAGEELAKILDIMVKNKIIIPDDTLEDHMRKRIGITNRSDEGQRQVQQNPAPNPGQEMSLSEKVSFAIKEKRKALGKQ